MLKRLFDWSIFTFLGIWLSGGVPFRGHLYLKHGADPRRAAILIGVLGYFFSPQLRQTSFILRTAQRLTEALRLPKGRRLWLSLGLCMAVMIAIGQALALRFTLYDVGIFHQILWSLNHGLGFFSTLSGAGNFLLDHFCPTLALWVPLFSVFHESPLFLPIIHVILIYSGVSAWVFLAARVPGVDRKIRMDLAAATSVFALGFESLWGNLQWGFHENTLAFTTLSWAFALGFSEWSNENRAKRNSVLLILLGIAALSKEILLLDVSVLLLVWAFTAFKDQRKSPTRWRWHWITFLLGLGLSLVAGFIAFEKLAHPPDKNYFNRYYAYLGQNLSAFFFTLIHSPRLILETIGPRELTKYFFTVFSPWLFLPLWAGAFFKLHRKASHPIAPTLSPGLTFGLLFSILPSLLSAALATFPPLRRPEFHYVMELWPALACLTILSLGWIGSSRLIWIWALFSLLRWDHNPFCDLQDYWKQANEQFLVRTHLQSIDPKARVSADEITGTWVASREWVTRWPSTLLLPGDCPDHILIQVPEQESPSAKNLKAILSRCGGGHPPWKPTWSSGNWVDYKLSSNLPQIRVLKNE